MGAAAGLHLVLCLPSLRQQDEPKVAAAARERGVGVYPLSPLFAKPPTRHEHWPGSFILGYASLGVEQIRQGVKVLAEVLGRLWTSG